MHYSQFYEKLSKTVSVQKQPEPGKFKPLDVLDYQGIKIVVLSSNKGILSAINLNVLNYDTYNETELLKLVGRFEAVNTSLFSPASIYVGYTVDHKPVLMVYDHFAHPNMPWCVLHLEEQRIYHVNEKGQKFDSFLNSKDNIDKITGIFGA